jgi:hypothetical protein
MKPSITTALSLSLLASTLSVASAQTSGRTTTSPTTMMQNSPTIAITRIGSQPSQPAPAEYFTGAARVSPLPPANEPSRLGGPIEEMRTGDVVQISPGVKHWHGSALIALNRPDQLRSHFALARENGVTQENSFTTNTHKKQATWKSWD